MIGDGMGYNTLDLANLYHRNTTGYQSMVKNRRTLPNPVSKAGNASA